MDIEVLSRSKYKNGKQPGDDVVLIEADKVIAVFDGSTDPTGVVYNGESSGRIAARAVARTVATLADSGKWEAADCQEIFQILSDRVRQISLDRDIAHPPSTTAAIAVDVGDHYRFLALGDTGIRINGEMTYQHHKVIDSVSMAARVTVYKILSEAIADQDLVELTTRRVIFDGLGEGLAKGHITPAQAEQVIAAAVSAVGLPRQSVRDFLNGGIRTQHLYANNGGPLGYAALNGKMVSGDGITDLLIPKREIGTVEIFSDGYVSIPMNGIRVADWEREFAHVEAVDFHKIGSFPAVKGSTSFDDCDDRTIVSVVFPH